MKNEDNFERKSALKIIKEEDKKIITDIINYIKKDPKSYPFLYPVDVEAHSDYLRIIQNKPMDIFTIEKKLSRNEYALVQDVYNDIKLIWYNCRIYNYENSEIYQFSDYLEKLADKAFENYYICYDIINKSINYREQYEKNIYNEDAFNYPDYFENHSSVQMPEADKQYYSFLYYKLKLKKIISSLKNEERKILFNKINENELSGFNKYIERKKDNNLSFKFHIELMTKNDILFLIDFINNKFNTNLNENNY